jgi:hypothetical protein
MKRVICKSGLKGSEQKLQSRYDSFEEFKAYSDTWSLAKRLGFKTAEAAWESNPTVQSSVEPSDFCKVVGKRRIFAKKCPACKLPIAICICERID